MPESTVPQDVRSLINNSLEIAKSFTESEVEALSDRIEEVDNHARALLLEAQTAAKPKHNDLFMALATAQGEIQSAIADKENTHFGFKYADLDACWDACRKPLSDNELCVIQIPSVGVDGAVNMRTILGHSSGQSISSEYWMHPEKSGPQALASCMTYLRRYMLCAMVGISQEDDDANAATKGPDEYKRIDKIQLNEILVLANKLFGEREDAVVDRMMGKLFDGIALADLPADNFEQVTGLLNNQSKRELALAKKKAKKDDDEKAGPDVGDGPDNEVPGT